jgi:benzylsuccinate CoA-transferase BbsF subunit
VGATERLARRDELDGLVAAWSAGLDEADGEARLVAAGVPAHRVQNSGDLLADPQLVHRRHFVTVPHPVHGEMVVEASRIVLDATPAVAGRAGPALGEHNDQVLRGLLGYDDDRVVELAVGGAFG